jgi:hypothetical protein
MARQSFKELMHNVSAFSSSQSPGNPFLKKK